MKLFKTSNYDIICECRNYFGFCLPSELLEKRYNVFVAINLIVNNRRIRLLLTTAIMLLMLLYIYLLYLTS